MSNRVDIPEWSDEFSVGNSRIDHQHRYFLDLIGHINKSIDSDSPRELIEGFFNELLLYARFHFCSEENMMAQYDYVNLDFHKCLHEQLIRDLTDKITHIIIGKADFNEIIKFLVDWFINHTVSEDTKFHQIIGS